MEETFVNQKKYIDMLNKENSELLINSLAEKDKKIAELKQQLEDTEESYNNTMRYLNKTRSELLNLPKKIVEEIKEQLYSKARSITGTSVNCVRLYDIRQILDTILKEYQK